MQLVQAMIVILFLAFVCGLVSALLLRLAMARIEVVVLMGNVVFWVVLVAGYLVYWSYPALFMAVFFEAN